MDDSPANTIDSAPAHTEPTDTETVTSPSGIAWESSDAAPPADLSLADTEPTDVETITAPTGPDADSAESESG
jgi:hypothetical protein